MDTNIEIVIGWMDFVLEEFWKMKEKYTIYSYGQKSFDKGLFTF